MDADELRERLDALPKNIQRWLRVDRLQVREKVIQSALDAFAATDSPEQREGIDTGLDFLGLIKSEGGDNALWQTTMELLDGEIYKAVAGLDSDEQVSLLLPLVRDLDGLATDVDADEWANVLRTSLSHEWGPIMRDAAMGQVESRSSVT